jgi:hypothetical protein
MRGEEAAQPAEESDFAVARQERVAQCAEYECGDQQQRPAEKKGERG